MQPIKTRITELLGITTPIISAPMGFATTPEMASAVVQSGGFGFLGAAFDTSAEITTQLQTVRTTLSVPDSEPIPVGVGLIGWILDKTEGSSDPRLPTVLSLRPKAIWFAFGTDLGPYIKEVREYDSKRDFKTIIFVLVNSVEDALKAAREWGVDVLVTQGIESGGHGGAKSPSTSLLLTAVLAALHDNYGDDLRNAPAVVAAGGVATGGQIASLLALGADGVVCGTRFLFTHECRYKDAMKEVLVDAGMDATARGMAFDEVNRTMGWPEGIDGRAIANDIWSDLQEGIEFEERLRRHDEGKEKGEKERMVIWAGVAVGITKEIKGVKDVVKQLHEETLMGLRRAAALLA